MRHGERDTGEHRDAVVGFLAHGLGLVAEAVKVSAGKAAASHLISCSSRTSGWQLLQPARDVLLALADRVDVPGGDLHGDGRQSTEKLVPQPQADLAFGLRTAKWLPISSSV